MFFLEVASTPVVRGQALLSLAQQLGQWLAIAMPGEAIHHGLEPEQFGMTLSRTGRETEVKFRDPSDPF